MSTAEILSELPRLSAQERAEIMDRLWYLEESEGPGRREKQVLDEAQARYEANPSAGAPWREVEARLRRQS